jgi:lysophospholipid acyltransferase (LPLAT)-like uncharacterized protein
MKAWVDTDRWLSLVVSTALRALGWTWRIRTHGATLLSGALEQGAVLAFWHGELMPMIYAHRDQRFAGMASRSRDGELLARIIQRLGYRVLRGSTSRGGASALREAQRLLFEGVSPALAVDGPRGPRHQPAPGAVALAARAERPIVYGVCHAAPVIRLQSWDRFEIPLPFARIDIHYGLMPPPKDSSREGLDSAVLELGSRLAALAAASDASEAPSVR